VSPKIIREYAIEPWKGDTKAGALISGAT